MDRIRTCVLISCLILATIGLASSEVSEEEKSVYELLESFDFPKGILPKNVAGYTLDRQSGDFKVFYDKVCKFSIEAGYELRYQKVISGTIKSGLLQNLRGVSVKLFVFWLDITSVKLVDNGLQFYVGILSASFPLSNFEECPSCGCGLDCSEPLPLAEY